LFTEFILISYSHTHVHCLPIGIQGRVCSELCRYLYSNYDNSTLWLLQKRICYFDNVLAIRITCFMGWHYSSDSQVQWPIQ